VCSVEVNNAWSCMSIPPIRLHSVVLRHKDSFTFPLPIHDVIKFASRCPLITDVGDDDSR